MRYGLSVLNSGKCIPSMEGCKHVAEVKTVRVGLVSRVRPLAVRRKGCSQITQKIVARVIPRL